MEIVNKSELKMAKFDKCSTSCDNDCSLGMLYDYFCAAQAFIMQKMKEAAPKAPESKVEELPNDEPQVTPEG